MPEYIATFTTGFGEYIQKQMAEDMPGIKTVGLYDGLIHFQYHGDYSKLVKLIYFNNIFYVLKAFRGKSISFEQMTNAVCKKKESLPVTKGSFRIRFSRENQFTKVDQSITIKAENHIVKESDLKINRVNPSTEIWYIIRTEGVGFYGQLLFKRKMTEKNLKKGELRPEFAYLMCLCGNIAKVDVVCDPFCGYGSIPQQLVKRFSPEKVIATDIDEKKIMAVKKKMYSRKTEIKCFCSNIFNLSCVENESVDKIVTDPPWGYYEEIEDIERFYYHMAVEFRRITKENATMVILSARKQELMAACSKAGFIIEKQINTLVNGKKAAVFIVQKDC